MRSGKYHVQLPSHLLPYLGSSRFACKRNYCTPPPSPRPAPPSPPLSSFCVGLLTLIPVLNAKLGLPPETLPFAHAFRENLKESRKMCVVGFVFGGWGVAMSNFFSVILRLKPLVLRTFLRFPRMQGGQSNDYGNRG